MAEYPGALFLLHQAAITGLAVARQGHQPSAVAEALSGQRFRLTLPTPSGSIGAGVEGSPCCITRGIRIMAWFGLVRDRGSSGRQ
jgi:hypothetical protein